MINGHEYSWEDVQITVEGKNIPLTGVKDIEFTNSRKHENIYGRGTEPVAMGRGQKEYKENTITLLQSEVEAMRKALPKGRSLTDRRAFSITVAFAPEVGDKTVHKLLGCRFTEEPYKIGTEDTHAPVECKFLPFKIIYNAE